MHSTKRPKLPNLGFSLAETMIGTAILGIVFASLFTAVRNGVRTIRTSQEQERARQILVEKAEQLRLASWSSLTNATLPTNFSAILEENLTNGTVVNGSVSIQANPFADSYASNLVKVLVSVTWTSSGRAKTNSIETLVAKSGIWTLTPP
jgi:type II secretory pathway pseudopilin PulG